MHILVLMYLVANMPAGFRALKLFSIYDILELVVQNLDAFCSSGHVVLSLVQVSYRQRIFYRSRVDSDKVVFPPSGTWSILSLYHKLDIALYPP